MSRSILLCKSKSCRYRSHSCLLSNSASRSNSLRRYTQNILYKSQRRIRSSSELQLAGRGKREATLPGRRPAYCPAAQSQAIYSGEWVSSEILDVKLCCEGAKASLPRSSPGSRGTGVVSIARPGPVGPIFPFPNHETSLSKLQTRPHTASRC